MINSFEHTYIEHIFSEKKLKEFNKLFKKQDPKYLGLHQENEVKLKTHYYIGYRWLDDAHKEYIHVSPKEGKAGKQADYLKMFVCCLKDPVVSKHLDETYKIFFDEKWIDIEEDKDEITPFLVLQFLHIVKDISKKGLKKGYIKVTENLTAKMKGKILVNQTIKQNHFQNRLDKTVCSHQVFTVNCIENRILKTALLQCSRYLFGMGSEVEKLLKLNLGVFESVESKVVSNNDFRKIKHSPFYKEYRHALDLGQMIFKSFGFTLSSSKDTYQQKIPPFYIDMPELFERYVEIKLREQYKDKLQAGYGRKNGNSYVWGLRPDFIVKDEKLIIDAKYKYWFDVESEDNKFKDDFQQLSLYGRVNQIRDDIGLSDNEEAGLLFIYPKTNGEINLNFENIKDDEDEVTSKFAQIYRVGIQIPPQE